MIMLSVPKLAKLTGRRSQSIRNLAALIPGAVKGEGGRWSFPESAVEWVRARKAGNPDIENLRRSTLTQNDLADVGEFMTTLVAGIKKI